MVKNETGRALRKGKRKISRWGFQGRKDRRAGSEVKKRYVESEAKMLRRGGENAFSCIAKMDNWLRIARYLFDYCTLPSLDLSLNVIA